LNLYSYFFELLNNLNSIGYITLPNEENKILELEKEHKENIAKLKIN
jgi:hypothetical protein